ncbi:type II restriction enzyme [Rummeliibacillus sp. JY-2-4R]
MTKKIGKTDNSWNQLFERYDIANEVEEKGFYEITANAIREYREPRLMTKFDHSSNLPQQFQKHKLAILPNSRSSYIIGKFNVYEKVKYNKRINPKRFELPSYIESIDTNNLYSESAALSCALVAGLIDDVVGEPVKPTVFGRMSSKKFNFDIKTKQGELVNFNVENSQIEIDGGYEGRNKFVIVEAKNTTVDDFLIRQLYYPYRLWKSKLDKAIKPVFFTYSNDIFSFFKYEFENPYEYNSIHLIEQRDYIINSQSITVKDIHNLVLFIEPVSEPEIPFPQADSFERVIDMLGLLHDGDLTYDEITQTYDFDIRQTGYYSTAAMYLGLVERWRENGVTKIRLSKKGKRIMSYKPREKYLALAEEILKHIAFRNVFLEKLKNSALDKKKIATILESSNLYNVNSQSTYIRRASTVKSWVNWIWELPERY